MFPDGAKAVAADCSLPVGMHSLDTAAACGEDQTASLEKAAHLSGSSKISAPLPNNVKHWHAVMWLS